MRNHIDDSVMDIYNWRVYSPFHMYGFNFDWIDKIVQFLDDVFKAGIHWSCQTCQFTTGLLVHFQILF